MEETMRFVGIDVAKAQLDVAIAPNGESFLGFMRLRSNAWPGPVGLHQWAFA
jgi:hypothetical protein